MEESKKHGALIVGATMQECVSRLHEEIMEVGVGFKAQKIQGKEVGYVNNDWEGREKQNWVRR